MLVLSHSLVRQLVHSHRSLVRLLRTARFARTLRCAHFAHSLARGKVNHTMAILSVFFSIFDHSVLSVFVQTGGDVAGVLGDAGGRARGSLAPLFGLQTPSGRQ